MTEVTCLYLGLDWLKKTETENDLSVVVSSEEVEGKLLVAVELISPVPLSSELLPDGGESELFCCDSPVGNLILCSSRARACKELRAVLLSPPCSV